MQLQINALLKGRFEFCPTVAFTRTYLSVEGFSHKLISPSTAC